MSCWCLFMAIGTGAFRFTNYTKKATNFFIIRGFYGNLLKQSSFGFVSPPEIFVASVIENVTFFPCRAKLICRK